MSCWAVSANGNTLVLHTRVKGSIPLRSTKLNGILLDGHSFWFGSRGRGFNSLYPDLHLYGVYMLIEAVTICKGYGDILREVAPYNRPLLKRWVVVTDPSDSETREVCRRHTIECVTTTEHDREGAFSKGRLINKGLAFLQGNEWMLHLDADILLPADMHQTLDDADLDKTCIHGCDRLNIVGYDTWLELKKTPFLVRQNTWAVHLARDSTKIGTRVANVGHGYSPIGFWQLWHGSTVNWRGSVLKSYPHHHGTAARTDVQFAYHWDRRHRILIPEMLVWHLESEKAAMGKNWQGRKTVRFGPEPITIKERLY